MTGDRQRRFEQVYADILGPVLGYALHRTRNPDDAADVLAETFLTAWRRLDDIPAGAQTRLWLYGVARRVLANHHRSKRRRTALGATLRSELASASYGYEPNPGLDDVAAAFRRRPDNVKAVVFITVQQGIPGAYVLSALDEPGAVAREMGQFLTSTRVRD